MSILLIAGFCNLESVAILLGWVWNQKIFFNGGNNNLIYAGYFESRTIGLLSLFVFGKYSI